MNLGYEHLAEDLDQALHIDRPKRNLETSLHSDQHEENAPDTWTLSLIYNSFSVIIGSTFVFGYNLVVVNEPEVIFEAFINDSLAQQSGGNIPDSGTVEAIWVWTVSLYLIGGIFGGLIGAAEANRWGRKNSMLFNSIVGTLAGILMILSPHVNVFELLMVGRFIAGIHCGSVSAIVPIYLTELAPLSLRGAAGTLNQVSICIGGLTASILGLPVLLNQSSIWPLLFLPCVVLPVVQFVLLIFCYDSPRWLMVVKCDEPAACLALQKLRKNEASVNAEIEHLKRDKEIEDSLPEQSAMEALRGSMGWNLVICVAMQLAQQLSGTSAALYYSDSMFRSILSEPVPEYASLGVVVTTVVFTVFSIYLVERLGRRTLMIAGLAGMWVFCLSIAMFMYYSNNGEAFDYLAIVSVFFLVAFFSIGPGPIPWFIAPELSLSQYRPVTIAICTFANWSSNLLNALVFPAMQRALGPLSFLPFFGFLTVFLTFSVLYLPETRGVDPEDSIQRLSLRKIQIKCGRTSHLQRIHSSTNMS